MISAKGAMFQNEQCVLPVTTLFHLKYQQRPLLAGRFSMFHNETCPKVKKNSCRNVSARQGVQKNACWSIVRRNSKDRFVLYFSGQGSEKTSKVMQCCQA